jgi:alkylhydroperoxidase family enzyme
MARIPYADTERPDIAPLAARIKAERGGKILNLYRMLLQSPPVAEGWLTFLTAIRQKSGLAARVRELVIMRVAVLNAAEYEFQHLPSGKKRSEAQGPRGAPATRALRRPRARRAAYTECIRARSASPTTFAAVRRNFDDREIVELPPRSAHTTPSRARSAADRHEKRPWRSGAKTSPSPTASACGGPRSTCSTWCSTRTT